MRPHCLWTGGLLVLVSLGLSAQRRPPPPTPPAGFYRVERTNAAAQTAVTAICYGRGQGGTPFGEGTAASRPNEACGLATVRALGEGWESRQRCTIGGRTIDYTNVGSRDGPGRWRVRVSARPQSTRGPQPEADVFLLHRRSAACPRGWRPGYYVTLSPHTPGQPYQVRRFNRTRSDVVLSLETLPPAVANLAAP